MSKLKVALAAAMMVASAPAIPVQIRERDEFDFNYVRQYRGYSGGREPRPAGVKFAEQYKKRYGSVSMNKTASGFLGFRKARKFIPESGMSLWVPIGVRPDLPTLR
jgi:hypothetical protein